MALLLNFVLGIIVVFGLSFQETVALMSSTIMLSFSAGPIALLTFRKQLKDATRYLKLPFVHGFAIAGFTLTSYIIYWNGFKMMQFTAIALVVGVVIFALYERFRKEKTASLDIKSAIWAVIYFIGLLALSFAGNFGGKGYLSDTTEYLLLTLFSIVVLYVAVYFRISDAKSHEYLTLTDANQAP
jgi:amino acid transporter